jgi:lipopolysaccharide transport system permease protein
VADLSTPVAPVVPTSSERRVVTRIRPAGRVLAIDFAELWRYHELLAFLVWKNIKVRYKQTVLGAAWALIQPVTTMIVFSVIFGHLAGLKADYGSPYPLFVFAGMLPWTFFATALTQGSSSIVTSSNLVTKVYFPRLIIPLSTIAVPIIDFLLGLVVFLGLFGWYGTWPHWHIVFIPAFLGIAFLTAFGCALFLAALNVRYRDVQYIVPFMTQLWLYLTPVIYPVNLIPQSWRWVLAINPMAGVVDGFRWSVLGKGLPDFKLYGISLGVSVLLALGGLVFFRRFERSFADVI